MEKDRSFLRTVCNIAIPVALQSVLQSSFSIIDQIMVGQLGSANVAGVGLAGKFASVYSVVVSAVSVVAGIMISQYMGQKNRREVHRSFWLNLWIALGLALVFTVGCVGFPGQIMGLYSKDVQTVEAAADYLRIYAGTFLPMACILIIATVYRCMEKATFPLAASIAAAVVNTGLNYVLIFGKFGMPVMGVKGAAVASVVSQMLECLVLVVCLAQFRGKESEDQDAKEKDVKEKEAVQKKEKFHWGQYLSMLMPILICEFLWSLGENVYAIIYGHLGTQACAAMTLTNPVQGIMIGALCGVSQAASVIVGKRLGNKEYDGAYDAGKKLIWYALCGSLMLSMLIVAVSPWYVEIYQVEDATKQLTRQILIAYALVAPFKVLNMTLGGGVIRSGGKTKYVMVIDMIGTWVFGVPLGLISAFWLKLPIPYVYFILSLEECVRFLISLVVFKKRGWMQSLE